MTADGFEWPKIVYRTVDSKLIACVDEEGRLREVYPTSVRLHDLPGEFPNEALRRLSVYSRSTRRKLARLVAYCPNSCPVLVVFAVGDWLLLKLTGETLLRAGYSNLVMTRADKPGRAAYLKHQPQWLTEPPGATSWRVSCSHGAYSVDSFATYDAACSAQAARQRRTVAVVALEPGRVRI